MIDELLMPLVCERYLNDERYRNGHVNIVAPAPGTKVLGVHIPELKTFAKDIVKSGRADSLLDGMERQLAGRGRTSLSHEERLVWAFVIDYMRVPLQERLDRITAFLPCVDNWAICDSFCCNAKWMDKEDREASWAFIRTLLASDVEFTVRTGLILAMCHFLGPDKLDRTFAALEDMHIAPGAPYYIRMGVAWLLATSLAKDGERTRNFVRSSDLPADIVKLYVRKARESRITRDVPAL